MSRYIHPITHLPPVIPIGVQTENGVCDVAFDVAPWLGRWPDLTIAVIVQRPGETESYPGVSDVEDGVLFWHVSDADTAIPGTGKVEILGVNADGLRKLSAVTATEIKTSIADAPGEAPEAIKPWMDDVLAKVGAAQQDVADLEESKLNTQQGAENAGAHLIVGEDGNVAPVQPGALKLTGAVEAEYDGSKAVEVEIPVQQPLTITKGAESTVYDGSKAVEIDVPNVFVVTVDGGLSNRTQEEIRAAVAAKKLCLLYYKDGETGNVTVYTYAGEQTAPSGDECPAFASPAEYRSEIATILSMIFVLPDRRIGSTNKFLKVPNPRALTITKGAESTVYDGSAAASVDVPDVYVITAAYNAEGKVVADRTRDEIEAALRNKKLLILYVSGMATFYVAYKTFEGEYCPAFFYPPLANEKYGFAENYAYIKSDGTVIISGEYTKIPNPHALTLSGAVTATYDGNAPVEVEIPADKLLIVTSTYDSAQGVSTPSSTYAEIKAAINAGKVPLFVSGGKVYTLAWSTAEKHRFERYYEPATYSSRALFGIWRESADINADGTVKFGANTPTTTPNPHALTIKQGDTETTYNGSEAVTVEIAGGGGGGTVETATDAEVLQALADADLMTAVGGDDYVLADENNNIIEW